MTLARTEGWRKMTGTTMQTANPEHLKNSDFKNTREAKRNFSFEVALMLTVIHKNHAD